MDLVNTTKTKMTRKTVTIHSSLVFDPKQKAFLKNRSIEIDTTSGTIISIFERTAQHAVADDDIDLQGGGRVVMPGLVDSHTHIFLHPYEYVALIHTLSL